MVWVKQTPDSYRDWAFVLNFDMPACRSIRAEVFKPAGPQVSSGFGRMVYQYHSCTKPCPLAVLLKTGTIQLII
jgi:hypothetical protein